MIRQHLGSDALTHSLSKILASSLAYKLSALIRVPVTRFQYLQTAQSALFNLIAFPTQNLEPRTQNLPTQNLEPKN